MFFNRQASMHGGPIPDPPKGIDPMNPDWSDPKMLEWAIKHLPHQGGIINEPASS